MAVADQVTGTVERVDPSNHAVWVNGVPYQLRDESASAKLADIKVGDKVLLEYQGTVDGKATYEVAPAKAAPRPPGPIDPN